MASEEEEMVESLHFVEEEAFGVPPQEDRNEANRTNRIGFLNMLFLSFSANIIYVSQ